MPVLLYDGVCGLCSRTVQFVLRRDRQKSFRFAALQSGRAAEILKRHAIPAEPMETFYLVENYGLSGERVLAKSDAALYVLRALGGIWRLAAVAQLLPRRWRDGAYDLVARRRYRWFGRTESCWVPDASWHERFLEEDY